MLHEDAQTVTGRTIGEQSSGAEETPGQDVMRPSTTRSKKTGGLAILRGNLAPEGCVVKVAGHERVHHRGPARACSSARRTRWRPCRPAGSTPATSS